MIDVAKSKKTPAESVFVPLASNVGEALLKPYPARTLLFARYIHRLQHTVPPSFSLSFLCVHVCLVYV